MERSLDGFLFPHLTTILMTDSILGIAFIVFVCVVIFLAIREIMTWYWKIDTIIKNQDIQIAIQKAILEELKKNNTVHTVGTKVQL
jgi:hypothetical protein